MRIKLPKNIIIGGVEYSVNYPYDFENENIDRINGLHDPYDRSITINKDIRSNQKIISVFLHEVLHAVDYVYNSYELCTFEDIIHKLSYGLYDFFSCNKFYNINKIPKYVDVMGNLIVVEEYDYRDSVTSFSSNMSEMSNHIRIANNVSGCYLSFEAKMTELMYNVVNLLCIYTHVEPELYKEKISGESFTIGIYETFKTINIESLIKEARKEVIDSGKKA